MGLNLKLLLATACTAALMGTANADTFVNGSFESGDLSGWTVGGGSWGGGAYPVADDYLPGGSQYVPGAAIANITNTGFDALTDNVLSTVYAGSHSVQVNNSNQDNSVSVISQRVNGYTDSLIAFAYSAVLESSHGPTDSDAFIVTLTDVTTGETLYTFNLNSATAPGSFTQSSSGWYYTNWITASVDVSERVGHDFLLSLLANDCPYGGHAGYAYLDGFGSTEGGGGTGGGGTTFHYWDGDNEGNADNGVIDGGDGVWTATATNWTDSTGTSHGTQDPNVIFAGNPGTVTVDVSAGDITVNGMQFAVSDYQIVGDPIMLDGRVVIQVGDGTDAGADFVATIDSVLTDSTVSGTAVLAKTDLGMLILNGVNTYTGGTVIEGGTLVGSSTSFGSGDIMDQATLVLLQWAPGNMANVIDGTGSLIKAGTGWLQLTAENPFSGDTTVYEGELNVAGSLANSAITVDGGAALSGNGTVGSVHALAGSFVMPGASIGTLHVAGNYEQDAASTLRIELRTTGEGDLVQIDGDAILASGAKLEVIKVDSARFVLGTSYTVLTTGGEGGRTGTFTLTGQNHVSAFIDVVDTYDASNVYLDVLQTHSFASAGATPNQIATGRAADTGTGALFTALAYLPTVADAQDAFDQLSGDIYPTATSWAYEDSRFIREAVVDQLTTKGTGKALWGRVFGSWGRMDSDGNAGGARRDIAGFFVGADFVNTESWQFGIAGGYDHAKVKVNSRSSSLSADDWHLAAYGGYKAGAFGVQFGGAYMWRSTDASRTVSFAGLSDTLGSSYKSHIGQLFADVDYRFDVSAVQIVPFGELAYISIGTNDMLEGGGAAKLSIQQNTANIWSTLLGARVRTDTGFGNVFTSAAWRHAAGDTATLAMMQFAGGGAPFVIGGLPIATNALAVDAGVGFNLGNRAVLDIAYNGQMSGTVSDQGARATLRFWF